MAFEIKKQETTYFPKRKSMKKASYLAWLHELPSVLSGRYGVEACHTSFSAPQFGHFGRAKSAKSSDKWALPLTPDEHRISHNYPGGEEKFWMDMGINPHIMCLVLWGLWTEYGEESTTWAIQAMEKMERGSPT